MPGTLNLSTPAQLVNNGIVIRQGFLKFSTFYNCPIWCGIRHTIGEAGPRGGFFGGLEITQNEAGRRHVAGGAWHRCCVIYIEPQDIGSSDVQASGA
jgi:hypothetical protein